MGYVQVGPGDISIHVCPLAADMAHRNFHIKIIVKFPCGQIFLSSSLIQELCNLLLAMVVWIQVCQINTRSIFAIIAWADKATPLNAVVTITGREMVEFHGGLG